MLAYNKTFQMQELKDLLKRFLELETRMNSKCNQRNKDLSSLEKPIPLLQLKQYIALEMQTKS